jgi:hypothetical protein
MSDNSRLPRLKDRTYIGLSYLGTRAQIVGTYLLIRPEQPVSLSHLGISRGDPTPEQRGSRKRILLKQSDARSPGSDLASRPSCD